MESYSSESSDSDGSSSLKTLDYSYLMLTTPTFHDGIEQLIEDSGKNSKEKKPDVIQTLLLYHNQLTEVPEIISLFHNLRYIDVSNNRLTEIPEFLTKLPLTTFVAKNNQIRNESLPKSFAGWSTTLKVFNFGGNRLNYFPVQLFELSSLRYLYLGNNRIAEIPRSINKITSLSTLCLGGNILSDVPESVGSLQNLEVLIVSDNKLESLPRSIANLEKLKTLQLHKNRLRTLPTEIITLKCLSELSLRENPLVMKFVNDMTYDPASLLELSARVIKTNNIKFERHDLPLTVQNYLETAHHCLNPQCNGVFFDNRVEHIKFVDFCGKYRVPLLQYLCSSKCFIGNSDGPSHSRADDNMMRKVLLG